MSQQGSRNVEGKPAQKEAPRRPRVINGFEIITKIGQGAMGAVFKARQVSLDRVVALKILPPKIAEDETYIGRFQREARASAIMNHPHIVQGIDVGQDKASGLWYFAMEYVDGPTLKEVLAKDKIIPEQRVLEIGLAMASALECAEQNKVIHRDIKPDNILINSHDEPKLADLGLAKRTGGEEDDASLTQKGKAVGTPHYMSPEQVRGLQDQLDIRSDIYALGGTLFHLLTGGTPFKGSTAAEIMSQHLTEKTPLAHRVCPDVSEATSRLLARMMEKDPARRVQSARELVAQFERLLDKGKTTGPRQPVRGLHATGPRAPIRGSGTTGPRAPVRAKTTGRLAPVRGATTGPRTAIEGRTGTEARGARKAPIAGIVGGGIAAIVVLGLAVMSLSGGKEKPPRPEHKTASKKPSPPEESTGEKTAGPKETSKRDPSARPPAPPGQTREAGLAREAQARNDFEKLIRFDGIDPKDKTERVKGLEAFLARHGDTIVAARARVMLAAMKTNPKADTKRSEEQPAVNPDAFAELQAFEGLAEGDLPGRIARVEAYLGMGRPEQVAARARTLLEELKAGLTERQAAREEAAMAASRAAEAAYAAFVEEYLDLLYDGAQGRASERLRKAEADMALTQFKASLAIARKAPGWLETLDGAVLRGATKLKDVDAFVLRMKQGSPMKVGKRQEFQVVDAAKGAIYVGSKDMSMPVKIDRLHPETRVRLIEMAGATDEASRLGRAFGMLLGMGAGDGAPDAKRVRSALSEARGSGAAEPEVAWIEGLVHQAELKAVERMAQNAWPPIEELAGAKNWDELTKALDAYMAAHGKTKSAAARRARIKTLRDKAETGQAMAKLGSLSDGLVLHLTFDRVNGNRIRDKSAGKHVGVVMSGARCADGGKEGNGLHLEGEAHVLVDKPYAFEWGAADYTLSAWVKTHADGSILSKAPANGKLKGRVRALSIRKGRLQFNASRGGSVGGRTHLCDGKWHHVVVMFRNEDKRAWLFTDGRKDAGGALRLKPDNQKFAVRIGHSVSKICGPFQGVIDEVRAYDRVLSHDEIRILAMSSERAAALIVARAKPAGGQTDDTFIQEVAKLPVARQYKRVMARLKELNPGFDPGLCSRKDNTEGHPVDIRLPTSHIIDLSPLRAVPSIRKLSLMGGKDSMFKDLTQLRGLELKTLDARKMPIESLDGLQAMPVEYLNISSTKVADLSLLEHLPLSHLFIGQTRVSDLSPLKGLKLRSLDLRKLRTVDLSPLAGQPIARLMLSESGISDLSILSGFPMLRELRIDHTGVSDLSPLRPLKSLRSLHIGYSKVTDLSPLKGMGLDRLDCAGVAIKDLAFAKGLPKLRWLNVSKTGVSGLGPLKALTSLRDLTISQTAVQNISPITGLKLTGIRLDYKPAFKKALQSMRSLQRINGKEPAEFWGLLNSKGKKGGNKGNGNKGRRGKKNRRRNK